MIARTSLVRRPYGVMHHFAPFAPSKEKLGVPKRWAIVCKYRGHIASKWVSPLEKPFILPGIIRSEYPNFCVIDGSPLVDKCSVCNKLIVCMLEEEVWKAGSFCWHCGEPFYWVTREERVRRLYQLLEAESLSGEKRVIALDQLAVLSEPADGAAHEDQVRAGQRIRRLAPRLWETLRPVLQEILTAEAKRQLGLP
jgi:hypothetical protein